VGFDFEACNREIYREIVDFICSLGTGEPKSSLKLMICGKIPCSAKTGNLLVITGNFPKQAGKKFTGSGNLPNAAICGGEISSP
jgi:hypothetical protein